MGDNQKQINNLLKIKPRVGTRQNFQPRQLPIDDETLQNDQNVSQKYENNARKSENKTYASRNANFDKGKKFKNTKNPRIGNFSQNSLVSKYENLDKRDQNRKRDNASFFISPFETHFPTNNNVKNQGKRPRVHTVSPYTNSLERSLGVIGTKSRKPRIYYDHHRRGERDESDLHGEKYPSKQVKKTISSQGNDRDKVVHSKRSSLKGLRLDREEYPSKQEKKFISPGKDGNLRDDSTKRTPLKEPILDREKYPLIKQEKKFISTGKDDHDRVISSKRSLPTASSLDKGKKYSSTQEKKTIAPREDDHDIELRLDTEEYPSKQEKKFISDKKDEDLRDISSKKTPLEGSRLDREEYREEYPSKQDKKFISTKKISDDTKDSIVKEQITSKKGREYEKNVRKDLSPVRLDLTHTTFDGPQKDIPEHYKHETALKKVETEYYTSPPPTEQYSSSDKEVIDWDFHTRKKKKSHREKNLKNVPSFEKDIQDINTRMTYIYPDWKRTTEEPYLTQVEEKHDFIELDRKVLKDNTGTALKPYRDPNLKQSEAKVYSVRSKEKTADMKTLPKDSKIPIRKEAIEVSSSKQPNVILKGPEEQLIDVKPSSISKVVARTDEDIDEDEGEIILESTSSDYNTFYDWSLSSLNEFEFETEDEDEKVSEESSDEDWLEECEAMALTLTEPVKIKYCKEFAQLYMDIATQNRIINDIKKKIRLYSILLKFQVLSEEDMRKYRVLKYFLEIEKLRQLKYLQNAKDFLVKAPLGPWDNIPIVTNDLENYAPSELICTIGDAIIRTYTDDDCKLLFA